MLKALLSSRFSGYDNILIPALIVFWVGLRPSDTLTVVYYPVEKQYFSPHRWFPIYQIRDSQPLPAMPRYFLPFQENTLRLSNFAGLHLYVRFGNQHIYRLYGIYEPPQIL
jgi:hypothetical protein